MSKHDIFRALDIVRIGAFLLLFIGLAGLDGENMVVPAAMIIICCITIALTMAIEKAVGDYLHERRFHRCQVRPTKISVRKLADAEVDALTRGGDVA